MQPTAVVQAIYAAFARGDVDTIVDHMTADIAWEPGMADHGVPWLTPGSGTDHVRRFFQVVAKHLDFRVFQPIAFLSGEGHVAVVIDHEVVVRSTGVAISDREVHLWSFDEAGKVNALRHFADTHQHVIASGARAAAAS